MKRKALVSKWSKAQIEYMCAKPWDVNCAAAIRTEAKARGAAFSSVTPINEVAAWLIKSVAV
jgi:hypothetical protein